MNMLDAANPAQLVHPSVIVVQYANPVSEDTRFGTEPAVVRRPAYSRLARPGCIDRASPVRRRAARDLGDADVGVGQHRLGSLDVVVGEFWRTASRPACAPSGSKTRLGALPDQAALEFR